MKRSDWKFSEYMEEIIFLAEISDVPGVDYAVQTMLTEMWAKYPRECEDNFVSLPR
jgi:hypothetical protein